MRTPLVAGNWKMNKTVGEARELVFALSQPLRNIAGVEKVLCPPFIALLPVAAMLEGTGIALAAQDMYWEPKGAFTGEISPAMVKEICQYVLIGHSERRTLFGESDEAVNRKVLAAQVSGLIPIVCVGETLAEREADRTSEVVRHQLREGLKGLNSDFIAKIIVAYEPVWAIGTGRASSGEDANTVIGKVVRGILEELFGAEVAQVVRVLYGGSVTAANAREFFSQSEIDGALVGGASLKPEEFVQITRAAAREEQAWSSRD